MSFKPRPKYPTSPDDSQLPHRAGSPGAASIDNHEVRSFETAEELLGVLAPIPSLDTRTPNPEFIFRGERNATWAPTPSALRITSNQTIAVKTIGMWGESQADNQIFAEFHLLHSFIKACDRAVIGLPGDSYEFRTEWLDDQRGPVEQMYRDPSLWPAAAHLPLLAAAQHHGVPTRLLDWSRNATIAAYFAAADVLEYRERNDYDDNERFQIWALNTEFLHIYKERIELVAVPGANSPRLGAQQGVFTLIRERAGRGRSATTTSAIDALVSPNEDISKPKPLWKLTLPCSEAVRLLYLCHLNGVDASTVYPGMVGAARAALEEAAWHRRDPATGSSAANSIRQRLR